MAQRKISVTKQKLTELGFKGNNELTYIIEDDLWLIYEDGYFRVSYYNVDGMEESMSIYPKSIEDVMKIIELFKE